MLYFQLKIDQVNRAPRVTWEVNNFLYDFWVANILYFENRVGKRPEQVALIFRRVSNKGYFFTLFRFIRDFAWALMYHVFFKLYLWSKYLTKCNEILQTCHTYVNFEFSLQKSFFLSPGGIVQLKTGGKTLKIAIFRLFLSLNHVLNIWILLKFLTNMKICNS